MATFNRMTCSVSRRHPPRPQLVLSQISAISSHPKEVNCILSTERTTDRPHTLRRIQMQQEHEQTQVTTRLGPTSAGRLERDRVVNLDQRDQTRESTQRSM